MKSNLVKRWIAFAIDALILFLVEMGCLLLMGIDLMQSNYIDDYPVLFVFFTLLLVLVRDIWGRSIGKMVMGLRIVRTDGTEGKPTVLQLVLRNITTPIWLVEAFFLCKGKTHSRFIDKCLQIDVV